MLEPAAAAASSGPFAPTQLYILLAITITTLGWLWPKENHGGGMTGRLMACWALVLGEILHLIANYLPLIISTEITFNVSAHVLLLSFYALMASAMLSSAEHRRMSVPPASGGADPRGNQVD